jgi:hypothetical protein
MWQWSIAALSGSFQIAKVTHALLAFIALTSAIEIVGLLKGKRLDFLDLAFCYAIVLNPIVTSQLFTFYLDSPLYLLSIILLGQLIKSARPHSGRNPLALFFSVVLLINTKLTGFYFAAALFALYLLIALAKRQPVKKTAAICVLATIFGVGFVGYYPYVTQTLAAGTPFSVPVDEIMALQRPPNLDDLPAPTKLAYSVFSSTDFRMFRPARLKVPLLIEKREIIAMGVPGPRIGGFGPLFALQLLVFLAFLPWLVYRRRDNSDGASTLVLLGLGVLVISAAFPEPWEARYVPVFWLVPLFIGLAYKLSSSASRIGSYVVAFGLVLASLNSGLALLGNAARTLKGNLELIEVVERAETSGSQLTISKAVGPLFHLALPTMLGRDGHTIITRPDQSCDQRIYNFHRSWICLSPVEQTNR